MPWWKLYRGGSPFIPGESSAWHPASRPEHEEGNLLLGCRHGAVVADEPGLERVDVALEDPHGGPGRGHDVADTGQDVVEHARPEPSPFDGLPPQDDPHPVAQRLAPGRQDVGGGPRLDVHVS